MNRVIRLFNKIDDALVKEVIIPDIPLECLQAAFNLPEDNPMYDSFQIGELQAELISNYMDLKFELMKYDYILEYDG